MNSLVTMMLSFSSFLPYSLLASDSSFDELEASIARRAHFGKEKESKIMNLKAALNSAGSLERKYSCSNELLMEYSHYVNDSALYYADQCILLAGQLGDSSHVRDIEIYKAYLLCFPGLYHEAMQLLDTIDPETLPAGQRSSYYTSLLYVYHYHIRSITVPAYIDKYEQEIIRNIDRFFESGDPDSKEHLNLLAYKYYLQHNYHQAIHAMKQMLERDDLLPYQRVEAQFNLGELYSLLGKKYVAETQEALIKASILANESVIRKNPPLIYLALFLLENNIEVSRAYRYINIADEDASHYSNDYKAGIIKKTRSEIEHIFYERIVEQQKMLGILIIILIVFTLLIGLILFWLFFKNKALSRIRGELNETNLKLRDSNKIKDLYISYYLNRYSDYLDKVETFKRHILRQVNISASIEAIKKEVTQSINTDDELNELFSDFDKSVLDLYPDFVEKINELLKEDRKYPAMSQREDNKQFKLNTELRILALLRLGVYENKQIASFFRFTVQTVYNYRSRSKARAINDLTFEEDVRKLYKND